MVSKRVAVFHVERGEENQSDSVGDGSSFLLARKLHINQS